MNNNRLNEYQQNEIMTASSEQLLIMLYDGAIRFTRQAILGVENNDEKLRRYGVSKALAIITEFSNSLDRGIGGKIAEDLDALYDFMIREMTVANIKNDISKLQVVEKLLVEMRQTWSEAIDINKNDLPQEKSKSVSSPAANVPAPGPPANYTPLSISR